jgi:formate--tetrahydrofolate ligase
MPSFWVATLLLMIFANPDVFHVFPASGVKPATGYPVAASIWDIVKISLPLYPDDQGLFQKIETIAKKIYRAGSVTADKSVRDQLKTWEDMGYANLPICMAKTQYSFTTDPNQRGAPVDHVVPVREVRLSAGAGFVVAICGEIMTMPGLPKVPASETIRFNDAGQIDGLF